FFKPEQIGQFKKLAKGTDTELCLALPYITREKASQRVFSQLKQWADAGIRRVLVQHLGQIQPVQELGLAVEAGVGVPVMNEACRQFFHGNLAGYTASVELNAKELKELKYDPACACVVYGRIPVMLTEQCPAKENGSCRKGEDRQLVDRMQEAWPMERHCQDCYNVFYSSKPIWIANRTRLLRDLPAGKWRMYFLEESAEQTAEIINQYGLAMAGEEAGAKPKSYMSGHYDKGVE
ncbi:MAG: hypothetical protein IJ315_06860, partial [Firmicutes bacterium]|nr:hypothetical protein [Bacillota bacterium]